jgi:hypothetical protein
MDRPLRRRHDDELAHARVDYLYHNHGRMLDAPEYLNELFEPRDRIAIFLSGGDRSLQKITTASVASSEPFQAWLHERNREGLNVYVAMNPLKPGSVHRHKEDIREITTLFVDLDRGGRTGLKAVMSSERVPKPSYVLWTSPEKFQAVWKAKGFSLDRGEYYLRGLVDAFKDYADPAATDRNRVLRLPGFANRKESAQGHIVQAKKITDRVYEPSHFLVRLDLESSRGWETRGHSSRVIHGAEEHDHIPNHETDWAEGMKRLERGDRPELVKEWLEASARDRGKPSPRYYSEHTLARMMNKLSQSQQHSREVAHGWEP